MSVAIGPGPELLQDPRRLPARRIRQAVTEGLWPGRLLLGVSGIPIGVMLNAIQRSRFLGRRLSFHVGPRRHRKRDVNAGAMLSVLRADRGGDRRPPVSTLRDIARISEAIHQHRPA